MTHNTTVDFDVTLERPTLFFIRSLGAVAFGPSLVGKKIVLFFKDSQAKDYEIFCSEAIRGALGLFGVRKVRMLVSACPAGPTNF